MYITTALAEAPSTATYQRPFSSAVRDVTEKDAPHILTILGGPSPWRQYLQTNLASHRKDLPSKPMRICDGGEFASAYRRIFGEPAPADAQGFVDRRNATMVLKEFPARNYGKTKVGLALHEAVHLFSHPPGKSNVLRATAFELLGHGLIEGITQMITDDILGQQTITPLPSRWQAYQALTPIARKFVKTFMPSVADAFFYGRVNPLINLIRVKWTFPGFVRLRELANRNSLQQVQPALDLIDVLNRPREFQQIFRSGR